MDESDNLIKILFIRAPSYQTSYDNFDRIFIATGMRLLLLRRPCRSYIILVPVFLYLCLMYRMLQSACLDPLKSGQRINTNVYIQPEVPARKIMQLDTHNETSIILDLAKEYEQLEQQRKYILNTLIEMIHVNNVDQGDFNTVQKLKNALENRSNYFHDNVLIIPNTETPSPENVIKPTYMINCTNVQNIKLKTKIGHGVSKQTFKAEYNGLDIAVKMVTRHQSDVRECIEKIGEGNPHMQELRARCFVFPTMKLMKEVLLLEQLNHNGFAQLLGYCIRNEESDTSDLSERGVVSVFELGERIMIYNIQTFTWQQRVKHAIELADFLDYLEHSPLGSLRVRDFKEEHFLMVNGSLKMIDLDDVDNLEPSCSTYVNIETQPDYSKYKKGTDCEFGIMCQKGLCIGFNAKQNMKQMSRIFFKRLLFPTLFPKSIAQEVGSILAEIDDNRLSAYVLKLRLNEVLVFANKI